MNRPEHCRLGSLRVPEAVQQECEELRQQVEKFSA
jgi:hypothetical protein